MRTAVFRESSCSSAKGEAGFTLTEIMVSMAVLMLALSGVLVCHLFGARLFQITKAKLGANDEARQAISMMIDEIRSAKIVRIGTGALSNFTEVPMGQSQTGNALQIHPTTNLNDFVRYYWDADDSRLKRTADGFAAVSIVANSITNELVFSSENYLGQILTNNDNNRVIGLSLQFYQIQYPIIQIGEGEYYDFYQLRTKITRRALE